MAFKRLRDGLVLFSLLFSILFLISCGGGSNGSDDEEPTGTGNGEAVAFARSEDIFDGAEAAFQASLENNDNLKAAYQAAANYLTQQPEIESVQFPQDDTSNASFIARLTSGLGYAITFRQTSESTPSPKPAPGNLLSKPNFISKIQKRDSGLPTGKKVLLIDSFWNQYQACEAANCPVISDILELKSLFEDHDYDVTLIANSSIDDFRNINNYDIVYIGAHGTYYEDRGVPHFAITTDQRRSVDYEESGAISIIDILVISEFNRGFGGIMKIPDRRYAVNEQFFSKNTGAFKDDSIVYADTCSSTERLNDFVAPPLLGVLSGFNLKTYLGWDDSVRSTTAVRNSNYVFSHMLGDIPSGLAYISEKSPPIRPNGLHAVMAGLEEQDWLIDSYKNTYSEFEYMDLNLGSREALLRPSIDGMTLDVDIENEEQKLTLTGHFGDREGSVEICDSIAQDADNCSELSVDEWNEDEIIVDLGTDCSENCSGGVHVKVEDHLSNVHPLTEWKASVKITGQYSATGPDVNMTISANFRAEIVDERATAEGDPEGVFSQAAGMLGLDSKVNYKFSGSFEDANYSYQYSGEGELTPSISGTQGMSGAVTLKPDEGEATWTIPVIAEATMKRTQKQAPFTTETQQLPIGVVFYHVGSIDTNGTISGDSTNLGLLTANYDTVTPSFAPDDETPR